MADSEENKHGAPYLPDGVADFRLLEPDWNAMLVETRDLEVDFLHLYALLGLEGVGPITARNLVAYCGSPKAVFEAPAHKLRQLQEVGPKLAARLQQPPNLQAATEAWRRCRELEVQVTTYRCPEYPAALRQIPDAPLLLYQRGELNLNGQTNVAVVGTRKPSAYGRQVAADLAEALAQQGLNVVSGMAYGIDAQVHRAVLQAAGKTTAVVAHGLDHLYPWSHKRLAHQVLECAGAWVAEHAPGVLPDGRFFPSRNRIIAGLCQAVIVVEAAEKGGALITAHQAFEYDRLVYALPGPLGSATSVGCHRLIRKQVAQIFTTVEDLLDDLGLQTPGVEPAVDVVGTPGKLYPQGEASPEPTTLNEPVGSLTPQERALVQHIRAGHELVDDLAEQMGLAMGELMPLLLTLEFRGVVRQHPGRRFTAKRAYL